MHAQNKDGGAEFIFLPMMKRSRNCNEHSRKILIVEDEKSIAHFISTILNSNDYETLLARSGSEAKTMISSHCPDLVILDLGLPDMDGIDVLRELRSWSSLPVVVVSARSHEHDKVQALDLGADDYLTKPFGTAELRARAHRHSPHENHLGEQRNRPRGHLHGR